MSVVFFVELFVSAVTILVVGVYLLAGFNVVSQWERRPYLRFGKYKGELLPGVTWLEPFSSSIVGTFSVRDQVDDLQDVLGIRTPSSVQTHDNVPVVFRALLTYRITDASKFVLNVEEDYDALWNRALTTISEFVGNTELDSILHDRQALYSQIQKALQAAVKTWGVEIVAVELKDVSIADASIQEAIAMKARAQKEAEAELVRAKMQTQIAAELKKAAATFDAAAWKLKGMETLLELCRSADNNTILVPTDLIEGLGKVMNATKLG